MPELSRFGGMVIYMLFMDTKKLSIRKATRMIL